MSVIAASPRGREVLKQSTQRIAAFLNGEVKKVAAESTDYGLLFGPLVGLAVQILKSRGLSRDAIETAVLEHLQKQFEAEGMQGALIQFPGKW